MVIVAVTSAIGASAPVTIAGGALDPQVNDADVYVDTPKLSKDATGPACRVAQKYITFVQNGQFEAIAELFSDDAVVLEPTRQNVRGRDAIVQFYSGTIGRMKPDIIAVSYVGDATDCMVAIAVRESIGATARYRLASLDHFTLDERGKAISMVAYVRPVSRTPPR